MFTNTFAAVLPASFLACAVTTMQLRGRVGPALHSILATATVFPYNSRRFALAQIDLRARRHTCQRSLISQN